MRYTLVIFDFDGTLADSMQWFGSVFNSVAAKYGFRQLTEAEMQDLRGKDAQTIMREIGVSRVKLPLVAAHIRNRMSHDIHQIQVFDGVHPMLHQLALAGVQLAIVSSNSPENVAAVLGESAHLINVYECGVDMLGKHHKLKKVLKITGVAPDQALYIGDEIRDSDAARRVHIAFGAVTWGYTLPAALREQQPVAVFDSVAAIADVVL